MKKRENVPDQKIQTANEFVNVRDIRNDCLYTKDGVVFCYIRIFSINIDLLSESEKESMTMMLSGSFKSIHNAFTTLVIPRTVDMEVYLDSLSNRYDEEVVNVYRKLLLDEMIREASKKVMNGQNFEHQFFLRIWEHEKTTAVTKVLSEIANEFEERYNSVGIETRRLNDTEILRLCNLFANGSSAISETYEDSDYIPMPQIKGVGM